MVSSKYTYQIGYPRGNGKEKLTDQIKMLESHSLLNKFKTYTKKRERVESKHILGLGTNGWKDHIT